MISPASTNPKVTEMGDYIFRVCFIDPFQGTVMSKFALSRGWKNVAVLTDVKQDYSVGLSQFFKEHFEGRRNDRQGAELLSGDKDFKPQLTSIKAANPDAIFARGYYTEAGFIANQARQLGITAPLLGGDGWVAVRLCEVGGHRAGRLLLFEPLLARRTVAASSGFHKKVSKPSTARSRTRWRRSVTSRDDPRPKRSSAPGRPKAQSCARRSRRQRIIRHHRQDHARRADATPQAGCHSDYQGWAGLSFVETVAP